MKNKRLEKIKRITIVALMLALTILFCFVPIQFFTITLALMILPTIILALVADFKTTLLMGTLMGVVNLIAWYTTKAASPVAPIFQNPIVCIVPRIMVGVCAYLARRTLEKVVFDGRIKRKFKDEYHRDTTQIHMENTAEILQEKDAIHSPAKKNSKAKKSADVVISQVIYCVATACGVVANTLFVALFTLLFFNGTSIAQNTVVTVEYVLAWFGVNFLIEVVAFSLISPPIALAIKEAKMIGTN